MRREISQLSRFDLETRGNVELCQLCGRLLFLFTHVHARDKSETVAEITGGLSSPYARLKSSQAAGSPRGAKGLFAISGASLLQSYYLATHETEF